METTKILAPRVDTPGEKNMGANPATVAKDTKADSANIYIKLQS